MSRANPPGNAAKTGASENELFAGEVHDELSEQEVFVGDQDFYKLLADSGRAAVIPSQVAKPGTNQARTQPVWHKHFSIIQKVLVVGIVVIGAVVVYALLKSPIPARQDYSLQTPAVTQGNSGFERRAESATDMAPQQAQSHETPFQPQQPQSLKVAQELYLSGDYKKAYAAYDQLRQDLPANAKEQLLRDFFQLKKALCMKNSADFETAEHLFRDVLKSRSLLVRAIANYQCSLLEIQRKQYIKAQCSAYQAIALVGAVDFDVDWASSMQRDGYFLVAACLSRYVLSLCDADKDIPEALWGNPDTAEEPFGDLSEAQLRTVLDSGSEQLSKGLAGPQIQKLTNGRQENLAYCSVVCDGMSIEELLARFSANSGIGIHWALAGAAGQERTADTIRKMPVTLYMPMATIQQVVGVSAGCVGLLAQLVDNANKLEVNIFDPSEYSSLSEHIALLSREAISLWQRFLLAFHGDKRVPHAHFALGLLQSHAGNITESIAEYKLVANRFSQSSLAPFALLHSSKLKTNLRDYAGAREDLRQLVEQYPDTKIADRAGLYLADATMKAGLNEEAERLYRKVYNLGLSLESQTAAALGAGKCLYEKKDYAAAAEWLGRYISLAGDRTNKDFDLAYFLLGKTQQALGKPQQACEAFEHTLAGQLSQEEYIQTLSALVESRIQQGHFVEALDVLESGRSELLSQKDSIEILLFKSRIFRAMGLADKSIVVLGDKAEYISAPQLKARILLELAKCHIAQGDLASAESILTESLSLADPGPLAHEIACELAGVCLKLSRNSQAVSICSQLLDSNPSSLIKQKALNILATAYNQQKNYDRAALAFLGYQNDIDIQNREETPDSTSATGQALKQAR